MRTQNLVISAVLAYLCACAAEPVIHSPPPYGQTVMVRLGAYCGHCVKQGQSRSLVDRSAILRRSDGAAIHVADQ